MRRWRMQLVILLIAARLATIIVARITIEFGSSKRRTSAQQQQVRPTKLSSNAGDHLPDERWQAKSDAEEAAPPPPPPFVTRGWLWKKGHVRHNWKRRYFVLTDDWSELQYYERASADGSPAGQALGRVMLGGAVASLGLDYVPKRAHVFSFTVRTKDDVYYCEAATEEERQRWVRTLNTAGAARRGLDEELAYLLRGESRNATTERTPFFGSSSSDARAARKGLPTVFESDSVDAMVDDVVAFHKERAVARLNRVLNSESTLLKINRALRGAYLVESIDLSMLDPVAGVAVRSAKLEPSPPGLAHRLAPTRHSRCVRLVVEFDWPQRLECRVRGARPAGGGLPPFLRALSGKVMGRHEISFSLASRLARRSTLALDLVSSRAAPWPSLRHVGLERLPRVELDRDALDVEDDRGFVGVIFSFVPKEVIAGLLENAINDALDRPGAPKLSWDVDIPRRRRDLGLAAPQAPLQRRPLYDRDHTEHTRYLSWLPSAPVPGSTVDALRSVAAIAASAARTAARDSALAAAKVQAAAESLRAAVLDTPDPRLSAKALAEDEYDDFDDEIIHSLDDYEDSQPTAALLRTGNSDDLHDANSTCETAHDSPSSEEFSRQHAPHLPSDNLPEARTDNDQHLR